MATRQAWMPRISDEEMWKAVEKAARILRSTPGATVTIKTVAKRAAQYPRCRGTQGTLSYLQKLSPEQLAEIGISQEPKATAKPVALRPRTLAYIRPRLFRRKP